MFFIAESPLPYSPYISLQCQPQSWPFSYNRHSILGWKHRHKTLQIALPCTTDWMARDRFIMRGICNRCLLCVELAPSSHVYSLNRCCVANVKSLTDSELDMFALLMYEQCDSFIQPNMTCDCRKCETPDIFDYVAEKRLPPPPLQGSAFMKKIIQWSKDRALDIRLHRVPNPT